MNEKIARTKIIDNISDNTEGILENFSKNINDNY